MKATKKLAFAAISLVAAASLTVGSTLAWFSYQSSVTLGAVDFSVDSNDENLQVAVVKVGGEPDLSNFMYALSSESIKTAINDGNATGSDNAVVYKMLTVAEDGGTSAPGNVTAANTIQLLDDGKTASAGSYATFDLVFRYTPMKTSTVSVNTNMPSLVLDCGSVITADPAADSDYTPKVSCAAWEGFDASDYGFVGTIVKDQVIKARARDAARVAFLFDNGTKNKVWAPSEAWNENAGVSEVSSDTTSDSPKGFYVGNLANDYNIHYGHVAQGTVVTPPTYESRVYAAPENAANTTSYSYITRFPDKAENSTYSQLRMTVKVWIEGKDGDSLSSIAADKFAFLLKFRTSPVASV